MIAKLSKFASIRVSGVLVDLTPGCAPRLFRSALTDLVAEVRNFVRDTGLSLFPAREG